MAAKTPDKKTAKKTGKKTVKKTVKKQNRSVSREARRRQKIREQKIRRLKLIFMTAAVLLVLGLYFGFAVRYEKRFIARTTVNGTAAGGLTADETEKKLQERNLGYKLTIHTLDGKEESIHGRDIDLVYKRIGDVTTLLQKQNRWLWPFRLLFRQKLNIDADVTYDGDKLKEQLDALSCIRDTDMLTPVDAYLNVNDDGQYEIVPEVTGTTVDVGKVTEKIESDIKDGTEELDLKAYQVLPSVLQDDPSLAKRKEEWNTLMTAAGLNYYFFDGKETIDAGVLTELLHDDGTSVTVSEDAVKNMVAGWAADHDTYNNAFTFHSQVNGDVDIPAGGNYGWQTDQETTAADVKAEIEAHNTDSHDVTTLHQGLTDENEGIGWSYIEISISAQTLWCYKDKKLVLTTPVVTGLPKDKRNTWPGCYSIFYKEKNATLGTLDTNGYSSPVSFWMPFNGNEGMHDAPWRTDFGGNIYQTDGSHGCVNCPVAIMKTLYNAAFENEPVIVY